MSSPAPSGEEGPAAFVKTVWHDWNRALFSSGFREIRKPLSRRRVVLRNGATAFGHVLPLRLPKVLAPIHPPGQNEALPPLSAFYLVQGSANTFGELVMLRRLGQHRVLPQLKHLLKHFTPAPPALQTTAKIATADRYDTETVRRAFLHLVRQSVIHNYPLFAKAVNQRQCLQAFDETEGCSNNRQADRTISTTTGCLRNVASHRTETPQVEREHDLTTSKLRLLNPRARREGRTNKPIHTIDGIVLFVYAH
jgi:hypothetical protein